MLYTLLKGLFLHHRTIHRRSWKEAVDGHDGIPDTDGLRPLSEHRRPLIKETDALTDDTDLTARIPDSTSGRRCSVAG